MPGMRNLKSHEVPLMLAQAKRRRDRLLVLLPICTAFRVKEVLSLRVRDVWCNGQILPEITVKKRNMKNGRGYKKHRIKGRTVAVLPELAVELRLYIAELEAAGALHSNRHLFATRESGPGKPMIYCRAQQIWKEMARAAGISPNRVNTQSGRKTFAREFYDASGHDLVLTRLCEKCGTLG